MPKLVIAIDGVVLREVAVVKQRTTLGRRPYNDVVIDNLAVSGEHAVLHRAGADVQLEDLNSTNGTYVNGRAIRRQPLVHADIIEIGKYKIRYVATDAPYVSAHGELSSFAPRSEPVPLAASATAPMPLGGASRALIRMLSGAHAGREVALQKVVTTLGKPGVAVAAVTRRLAGYVVIPVDGEAFLNGEPLGTDAVALQDGDVLELDGTRMQFVSG